MRRGIVGILGFGDLEVREANNTRRDILHASFDKEHYGVFLAENSESWVLPTKKAILLRESWWAVSTLHIFTPIPQQLVGGADPTHFHTLSARENFGGEGRQIRSISPIFPAETM